MTTDTSYSKKQSPETLELIRRGFYEAAHSAGVRNYTYMGRPGWQYPVYDYATNKFLASRWKAADGKKPKYLWLPEKPKNPAADWYILPIPSARFAITAAGGVCYLANGEPSVWTYMQAGIKNVISTTASEVAVPANVLDVLRELGVTRLLYPVDNDKAGHKSGENWRNALLGSMIDFEVLEWPPGTPEKGDANDVWQSLQFDQAAFRNLLDGLKPLDLPAPVESVAKVFDDRSFDETPAGLIEAIAARLGVGAWKSNGWSRKNFSSPFREDKDPSCGLLRSSGVVHDFGTGENHSPRKVAEQLGIDWRRFYPERSVKPSHHPRETPTDLTTITADDLFEKSSEDRLNEHAPLWWAGAMPDSWRTAILNYMPPTAAPLIEAIHEAARQNCIDPTTFTIQQVFEAAPTVGFDLPKSSLSRTFKQIAGVFFSKSDTYKNQNKESDSEINSSGRRSETYQLRPLADVYREMLRWARPRIIERHLPPEGDNALLTKFESTMIESLGYEENESAVIAQRLNEALAPSHAKQQRQFVKAIYKAKQVFLSLKWSLIETASSELPDAVVKSGRDYRALYVRADVEAEPDKRRSAREIAEMIGMQRQNVKTILKRAGVGVEEQFETVKLQSVDQVKSMGFDVKGWPQKIIVQKEARTHNYPYEAETAPQIVREAFQNGHEVKICYQVANKQRIVRDEPLPPAPPEVQAEQPIPTMQLSFSDLQTSEQAKDTTPEQPKAVAQENSGGGVQRPEKVQRMKYGNYFGSKYDPNWTYAQLALALSMMAGRYVTKGVSLVDTETGEVVRRNTSQRDLLAAIWGESFESAVQDDILLAAAQ